MKIISFVLFLNIFWTKALQILSEKLRKLVKFNSKRLLWKEYNVTPSHYMIKLKKTIFRYFKVKIQLLLINLNRKLLVFKLNAVYMQACI